MPRCPTWVGRQSTTTMEQQAARQPDFGRLASNFKDIGEQVQRFENIPAFEGGTQLMRKMDRIFEAVTEMRHEINGFRTEMTDMRREMTDMRRELDGFGLNMTDMRREMTDMRREMTDMRREMTDMRRELDGLGLKMMITDKNFQARMANSIVVSGEMTLSPLYNVTTGEELSHCPETLADLEQCDGDIAAAILRELGERVPRAHEQRRRQLKLTFGIRTRVI
ncbi:hypothetical protein J3458_013219 [Metarhizium acridum]|uniref:uncharacterized protein n=1 Tax=Metarhizium acridum TaxID=92637 RepID=UPI001C6B7351|nr:hypothetical protein J3458_013219 [Metarhizium acridum]